MSDALGAMRARVTLQAPARVADEIGGAALLWSPQGDVWAAIEAEGAGEIAAFDTLAASRRLRLTINRFDGVAAGWRASWGERRLRVVGVLDEGAPRIILLCEEIRP